MPSWRRRQRNGTKKPRKGNDAYNGEQKYDTRTRNRDESHKAIDDQLERREHSLKYATKVRDTSMQSDLVAAAVEAAVIKVFELGKEDADKTRGRSRITFSKKPKGC